MPLSDTSVHRRDDKIVVNFTTLVCLLGTNNGATIAFVSFWADQPTRIDLKCRVFRHSKTFNHLTILRSYFFTSILSKGARLISSLGTIAPPMGKSNIGCPYYIFDVYKFSCLPLQHRPFDDHHTVCDALPSHLPSYRGNPLKQNLTSIFLQRP